MHEALGSRKGGELHWWHWASHPKGGANIQGTPVLASFAGHKKARVQPKTLVLSATLAAPQQLAASFAISFDIGSVAAITAWAGFSIVGCLLEATDIVLYVLSDSKPSSKTYDPSANPV